MYSRHRQEKKKQTQKIALRFKNVWTRKTTQKKKPVHCEGKKMQAKEQKTPYSGYLVDRAHV
jgi:hypothetical protein